MAHPKGGRQAAASSSSPPADAAAAPPKAVPLAMSASLWKAQLCVSLLGFGRRHRWVRWAYVLVPFASMATVVVTVVACLRWWRSGPHFVPGLVFPAISELGVAAPEKQLYQVGFGLGGELMSAGILLFELLVAPQLMHSSAASERPQQAKEQALLDNLLFWGHASAAGVSLQGVFTLEHTISSQCFVHWGGAMLFMGGAMQHAKASGELYEIISARIAAPGYASVPCVAAARRLLADGAVALAVRLRHFILNYASMVLFGITLLAQFVLAMLGVGPEQPEQPEQPAVDPRKEPPIDLSTMNMMGFMQWGIILQFVVYFCTYAADLRAAVSPEAAP
mmetsp:Transcript_33414/g.85171  ORF Transcript_33414/g.85171 Transcript_33414/m.85171 type:complete len:336 (-) Transcript_33414:20-1027(-)